MGPVKEIHEAEQLGIDILEPGALEQAEAAVAKESGNIVEESAPPPYR